MSDDVAVAGTESVEKASARPKADERRLRMVERGLFGFCGALLLIAVPVLGTLLLGGSILGNRMTRWFAIGGSGLILLFGFVILVRLFITSTGLGMWLVILSALLGLSIGLVGVGRARAR